MAKRNREIQLKIFVSAEEQRIIKYKMDQLHTTNFSAYARKMLIDGYVIKRDFEELKALSAIISRLAGSINQVVKRCNETRNIYKQDVLDLQQYYAEVKSEVLKKILRIVKE